MRDLFEKLRRDGVIAQDMTFSEFVNSYNTTDKVADLHAELTTMPELLTEESKNFNNFLGKYFGATANVGDGEIDDTKIDPIQNIYENADLSSFSNMVDDRSITQQSDDNLINDIEVNYAKKKKELEESNKPNKTYLLKKLDEDYENQKEQFRNVSYTNNLVATLPNYGVGDSWNPEQNFKYKQNTKELNILNPNAAVETETEIVSQGIHSLLFPQQTTNALSAAVGLKDNSTSYIDDLFTRKAENTWLYADRHYSRKDKNLLKPILEAQYPGYTVEVPSSRKSELRLKTGDDYDMDLAEDGEGQVYANAEKITLYNVDKTASVDIYTEIESRALGDSFDPAIQRLLAQQKYKIAKFVNENGGIDLEKLNTKKSNILNKQTYLLNRPYDNSAPSKGGIAPNPEQQDLLSNIGNYDVNGKFSYNPNLFRTNSAMIADYIKTTSEGNALPEGISQSTIDNPYTKEAEAELKAWSKNFVIPESGEVKMIRSPYDQNIMVDGAMKFVKKGELIPEDPNRGQTFSYGGKDTPLPFVVSEEFKELKNLVASGQSSARIQGTGLMRGVTTLSDALRNLNNGFGSQNPYMKGGKENVGPGSEMWRSTEEQLKKQYVDASGKQLPVPAELIKQSIAEKFYNSEFDNIEQGNLKNYLRSADNDNYTQQLASYYNVVSRDKNLDEAMGLMANNEVKLKEYLAAPELQAVNSFESIYNDPDKDFIINDESEIVTLRNGKPVNQKTLDEYIAARQTQQNKMNAMFNTRQKVWDLEDEVGDNDAALHLLGKQYDTWNQSMSYLGTGFTDIVAGVGYLASKIGKYGPGLGAVLASEGLQLAGMEELDVIGQAWARYDNFFADKYDDYSSWKEGVQSKYGEAVSFRKNKYGQGGAFSNASNFGSFVANEVGKQIPILATLMATGGQGAWAIGAYSAGQHWADGDREEFITGKVKNEFLQAVQSIGYGASEAIFERFTTIPILKRGQNLIKNMGKESMLSYKNAMKQYIKQNSLHLATDPILEAGAEFGTTLTQNFIDGKPVLENADHAAFVGGMFGHAMSITPFMAGLAARQFTDYNTFEDFRVKETNIINQQRALDDLVKNNKISKENQELQQESIDNLQNEQDTFIQNKFGAIRNTTEESAFNNFYDAVLQQGKISKVANEILDYKNPDVEFLETLKGQFDQLQFKKDSWKNNENFANRFTLLETSDKSRYDRITSEAKQVLEKEGKGEVRDDQVSKLAERMYTGELIDEDFNNISKDNAKNKRKYFKFDTNSEAITYLEDVYATSKDNIRDSDLSEDEKKTKIQNLESKFRDARNGINNKVAEGKANGVNITFDSDGVITFDPSKVARSESLIFRENAILNGDVKVATHEASHGIFNELLGTDSKAFDPLAEEIVNYLKSNDPKLLEYMQVRRGGALKASDEVVMNFLELVGKGKIDLDNNQGGLMSSSFGFLTNGIFKSNKKSELDLAGQNGAIKYLYDLGKAVSEGRITSSSITEFKKSKVIKDAKTKFQESQKEIKKIKKDLDKALGKKVVDDLFKDAGLKLSGTTELTNAADVLDAIKKLAKEKPTGWKEKAASLTKKFQDLKQVLPKFKKGESNSDRKERVNKTELLFRGELGTARQGAVLNEILKGYETNIIEIAGKANYFNTDPYESLTLQEAKEELVSLANIELTKSIKNFDPTKNNDFDAYLMSPSILPNKVKRAHNLITKKYGDQLGFKQDLSSAVNIAAKESLDQTLDKTLREDLGIETGGEFYNAIMEGTSEMLSEGLPTLEYQRRTKEGPGPVVTLDEVKKVMDKNPTGETKRQAERDLAGIYKNFTSELESKFAGKFDKLVKKEFVKSKVYDSFLKQARPYLLSKLPIEDLVALERLSKEKILAKEVVMDKATGRTVLNPTEVKVYEGSGNLKTATTTQGPKLYERLNPSSETFNKFFKVRGRNNALAKILSKQFGLDATMEVLTNEKFVKEATANNPDMKKQLGSEMLTQYATAVGRGTGFKFSEDLQNSLGEDVYNKFIANKDAFINNLRSVVENNGFSNDVKIRRPQIRSIVELSFPEGTMTKAQITKVVNKFNTLLAPFSRQLKKNPGVNLNVQKLVDDIIDSNTNKSYADFFNTGSLAGLLRKNLDQYGPDIQNQRSFMNLNAQQMLKLKDAKGNLIYPDPFELAATYVQYKGMMEDGYKSGERAMLYGNKNEFVDGFLEGFIPNLESYQTKKKDGTVEFKLKSGEVKVVESLRLQTQAVSKDMINNNISEKEMADRKEDSERAFDFVVNNYKAAKQLLDENLATNDNIALLAKGMGENMKGPIRAAARLKYLPVNPPTTQLNIDGKKQFEYEHGIPALVVNLAIADAVLNDKSKVDLKKLQENYTVGVIHTSFNDNFGTFFQQSMPSDYKIGDSPISRWINEYTKGGAAHELLDIETGEIVEESKIAAKLYEDYQKAREVNVNTLNNEVTGFKESSMDANEVLGFAATVDESLANARDLNAPVKKIRVFDFDDTLATSKNLVNYTMPDGTKGQLNAEEFAEKGSDLVSDGAKMDFTDFNTVREGGEGPLADLARTIINKRGSDNVFVLTARSSESAQNIHEFLKGVGINIPLKNITGLGDGSPHAKSRWIVEKAANGFNDFYFADDAIQNVKAVKEALGQIDVKSKVQQAKFKFSEEVDTQFNDIIESATGIKSYKEFSAAKAAMIGKGKDNRMIHPYSAEDFEGLLYPLLGKGKAGDQAMEWFNEHLIMPYVRAEMNMQTARTNVMDDFRKLRKDLNAVPKNLRKINDTGFSNENSARIFIWNSLGYDVPGLSKSDLKEVNDYVLDNFELRTFAEQVIAVNKGEYMKPDKSWLGGGISSDILEGLNTVNRKKYLEQWQQNVDVIFSEKNLNKLEAALGPRYREALENMLARMKSGNNRLSGQNRIAGRVLDYLNNAQGVVMFFNMRSALLQSISAANFLNWSNNNILKAGKAFANQPQYWSDFMELINSDYLVDRRNGLSIDLQGSEISNAAKTAKNKFKAAVSYIIEKGYSPTKFMDSFAIASGGATFYRNRLNELIDQGFDEKEAKAKAYEDFVTISEKSQQSSRPDKTSSQQASDLGRIFLNWANTQMQYVRIQKKAIQDISNRRGNDADNVSKIIYYGLVQNLWFQAAHAGMFALGFGDYDEEDDIEKFKDEKTFRVANGIMDSQLRGLGIPGHIVSVLKNTLIDVYERSKRSRPEYVDAAWKLIALSPVVDSKVKRIKSALWYVDSKKRRQEMIDKGFSLDNPAYEATAKVVSAVTNVPLDRLMIKMQNLKGAFAEETATWMRIALALGWSEWELKPDKIKKEKVKKDKFGNVVVETKEEKVDKFGNPIEKGGYKKQKTDKFGNVLQD